MDANTKPDAELVLVTGGAGFIGSELVPLLLKQGYRVRVLDPLSEQVHGADARAPAWLSAPACEFIRASVTDRAACEQALQGADHIVHLAAETGTGQSMYEIARYNEVNVMGTAMLFDVLVNQPGRRVRRVVLASSRSVYGEGAYRCPHCSPQERAYPSVRSSERLQAARWEPACRHCGGDLEAVPTRESDAVSPASVYASTKLAQEDLVKVCCQSLGIGYALLRLQNVYGEGQSLKNPYTGLLSIFSNRVRRGEFLPLFEDGLESRDFVHVSDVAEAMRRCLAVAEPVNSILNVGSGVGTSVQAAASLLSMALGATPQLRVTGEFRIGDIRHNVADVSRLAEALDFAPQVSLEAGLRRFGAWVMSQELQEDRLAAANAELMARGLMGGGGRDAARH
ncbi:NAD-dependent epimerase/dehydratase family protein [Pelomonas sp. SE-A7]|uniref:NAD-dependent epimerase/dehydratase family protein n=1 Tax=Pelomonas sp. SE-A7 TaxID=3054953 RepID=UPI00259CE9C7|nr:NAD-dependent epimerase/dehydratase family protein [Pelomonas sp. SE-A7]MDM4764974.1 SDR family NAD(P)-dependent oxidoreductase [Pelomonas sp. SE-A7]